MYSRTIGVKYETPIGTFYLEQDFDFENVISFDETLETAKSNMNEFLMNYFLTNKELNPIAYSEPKRDRSQN